MIIKMENLFLFDLMDGNITQTSLGMVFKNLKGWNWNLKIFYKQQIQFNIIEVFSWKTTSHESASTDFSPKNKEMNFRNLDQEQHTQESNTQAYRVMLAMEMQVGLKSKETKYRTGEHTCFSCKCSHFVYQSTLPPFLPKMLENISLP